MIQNILRALVVLAILSLIIYVCEKNFLDRQDEFWFIITCFAIIITFFEKHPFEYFNGQDGADYWGWRK